ncbi:SPOR domain-containing protein [uncultured Desulfosarcina sp.]|uniref:SPOR domain-containing protein n=1 Tax=uncultured Desulfosarcina sp. TaxID=218289 RepID=UPI0029C7B901|nr:SPOR domain-containing protein [uncultured Desulfosarcina sp.]
MTEGKATALKRRIAWGRYLLVFFVAAWMFVLGVLVGRGTAPVNFDTQALQKELAALRDAMMKKERDAVEKAIRGEDEKAPLEFYEALKKDGPDITVQIPAPEVSTTEPSPQAETVESLQPPHKSRTAVMAKKSTAADTPTVGTTPAAAETPGNLTIQVASLKDGAAAERIVANLKKDGYPAYLSRIVIPDKGLWFRVRVGRYTDREQATADMDRLTRGQRKPILVKK